MKRFKRIKLPIVLAILTFFRLYKLRQAYIMRFELREKGFIIFVQKKRAIRRAKKLTKQLRVVYWVMKEDIGYYVINLEHIRKLNKNEMSRKGGKKIHTRLLDKECVWRSPLYSTI